MKFLRVALLLASALFVSANSFDGIEGQTLLSSELVAKSTSVDLLSDAGDICQLGSLYSPNTAGFGFGTTVGNNHARRWDFTLNTPTLEVTTLGANTRSTTQYTVSLWNADTQTRLGSVTVSGVTGQWVWADLASSITLTQGTKYAVVGFSTTPGYGVYIHNIAENPLITMTQQAWCQSCSANTWPTNTFSTSSQYGLFDFKTCGSTPPTPAPTAGPTAAPTPAPTSAPTQLPTPAPTPDCGFDCSLDPAVICNPPRFDYQHSRVLLNGQTYLQIQTTIPKIWMVASTRFVGETLPHGVTDMNTSYTHSQGNWHMNASDFCESTLVGLVPWDSLWQNGALSIDHQSGYDEYEFVFGVDAEREFAYSPPVLLEKELEGLPAQPGYEIQRSSNEFPVSIIFENEVTVELDANIISEQIAVVLQSATLTTTQSTSAPFANAELIFSTFVTNPVWLGNSATAITVTPANLGTSLTILPENIPGWSCSNTDPQCRQQWAVTFPLNLCELDHSFDVFFDVHCNAAEFPACGDILKPGKITIEVESPDICPKALEPVTLTATSKFITQSGQPTAYFFSDQTVAVRVDLEADAEIVAVEVLDVDVTPAINGSTLRIWEFSNTVAAYHPETSAAVQEFATYAIFSFTWSTNLFAPPPAMCTVRERLLVTYSSGNKLLLEADVDLLSANENERPENVESSVAVIADSRKSEESTERQTGSAAKAAGSVSAAFAAVCVALYAM